MYHRRENRESKGEDSLVGFQWGQTYGYTPPSKSDAETGDKMFQGYTATACGNTENGGKIVEGIFYGADIWLCTLSKTAARQIGEETVTISSVSPQL